MKGVDASFSSLEVTQDISATTLKIAGHLQGTDASFSSLEVAQDISATTLKIAGDLSGVDASFVRLQIYKDFILDNNGNAQDISGAIRYQNGDFEGYKSTTDGWKSLTSGGGGGELKDWKDASFNYLDVSKNLVIYGDLKGVDASFSNLEVTQDISATTLKIAGHLQGTDASFSSLEVAQDISATTLKIAGDLSGVDASFVRLQIYKDFILDNNGNAQDISGAIRYQNGDFEGYKGTASQWVSLTSSQSINSAGQSFANILTQQPGKFTSDTITQTSGKNYYKLEIY